MNIQDWFGMPSGTKDKPVTAAQKLNYGMGVGMGALNLAGNVMGNLASNKKELDQLEASPVVAGSKDALAAQIGAFSKPKLGRENEGMAGFSGLLSGASSGIAAGPLGAIAGGVAGLASGLFGSSKRNRNRKNAENRLLQEQLDNFQSTNAQLSEQGINNALINYAAYGGQLSHGGLFSNDLQEFNTGGTHGENPYGGIPVGMGENGKMNTVEEGEVMHNNFVYSNRLNLTKELAELFKLPLNKVGKSFADVAKFIGEESKERPHDPISRTTKEDLMNKLMIAQELHKQKEGIDTDTNTLEKGGTNRKRTTKEKIYHTLGAMQKVGAFPRGIPGMSEALMLAIPIGFKYGPWGLAASATAYTGAILNNALLELGTDMDKLIETNRKRNESKERSLQMIKDYEYGSGSSTKDVNSKSRGGQLPPVLNNLLHRPVSNTTISNPPIDFGSALQQFRQTQGRQIQGGQEEALWSDLGMLAPALGNLGTLAGVVNSTPDKITIPRIRGNQRMQTDMPYNPMDTNYMLSRLSAQAGATRRGLVGMASGNRGAATSALLSADYNYSQGIGDIYNRARDYNRQQLMQNIQMANQARQANAQLDMQEQIYNQQAYASEWDINARNMAARRNAINQGTQALTSNLSDLSRYLRDSDTISNMYRDYTSRGKYRK